MVRKNVRKSKMKRWLEDMHVISSGCARSWNCIVFDNTALPFPAPLLLSLHSPLPPSRSLGCYLIVNMLLLFLSDCKVFICDFHREQAWERWLSKGANRASSFKSDILCRIRRIAHASTVTEYKEAVAALEEWEVWNRPELKSARHWFLNTWIQEHKVFVSHCHSGDAVTHLLLPFTF